MRLRSKRSRFAQDDGKGRGDFGVIPSEGCPFGFASRKVRGALTAGSARNLREAIRAGILPAQDVAASPA